MTVALSDTALLCDLLSGCDLGDAAASSAATGGYFTARKPWAATINTLANALYAVFAANGAAWGEEMRQARLPFCLPFLYFLFHPTEPSISRRFVHSFSFSQACFDYLKLGGVYAGGPISLLSGLNPRPAVLVAHFFGVALYGVGRLLLPVPTPRSLWLARAQIRAVSLSLFSHAGMSRLSIGCAPAHRRGGHHPAHHPRGGRAGRVLPKHFGHSSWRRTPQVKNSMIRLIRHS